MEYKNLKYYPIAISLKRKKVLVVGGGEIAYRKIKILLSAKSDVKVISPEAISAIKRLAQKRKLKWTQRKFKKNDIKNINIAVAATNNKRVNKLVSEAAKKAKVWINVVDQPLLSDFISPAIFNEKEAIVAVYTDGKDPALSRDLKNFLKENWCEFLHYRNKLQNNFKI